MHLLKDNPILKTEENYEKILKITKLRIMREEGKIILTSAGGIMKDAFTGMERNRNALRSNRERKAVEYELKRTTAIKNTNLTETELKNVISKIQLELETRRKRKLIAFFVSSLIVTIISLLFLY